MPAIMEWPTSIWVVVRNGKPIDYAFSRALAFKKAAHYRETQPKAFLDGGAWTRRCNLEGDPMSKDVINSLEKLARQNEDYIWRTAVAAIAEIERLRVTIERTAIGGNHLANVSCLSA